jgi:hypothetical protein
VIVFYSKERGRSNYKGIQNRLQRQGVYGTGRWNLLHSINVYIIIYSSLIYKVLSITYSRLLRGTYINYNAIEFLRGIAFYSNIYK